MTAVAVGQVWDVVMASSDSEDPARVTVLVLSVERRFGYRGERVVAVTIDSTRERVWPTGEVIDSWEARDFLTGRSARVT